MSYLVGRSHIFLTLLFSLVSVKTGAGAGVSVSSSVRAYREFNIKPAIYLVGILDILAVTVSQFRQNQSTHTSSSSSLVTDSVWNGGLSAKRKNLRNNFNFYGKLKYEPSRIFS